MQDHDQPSVALLFGGRSGEHEVSVRSATSVGAALMEKHRVHLVRVGRDGAWDLVPDLEAPQGQPVFMAPSPTDAGRLRRCSDGAIVACPDVFFPLIHGTFGEDGTLQGLLELAGVPYVGAGVLASATGMDKGAMKALFAHAGIPQCPYQVVHRWMPRQIIADAASELGWPVFVKPANMGSSVGVSQVPGPSALNEALDEAFAFDTKVVLEAAVLGREIEVSVLGNETPEASLPGEIVADREFYDYDSKYADESRTVLHIPAPLSEEATRTVRELALRAFRAIDASGYARVDFFLEHGSDRWLANEINTIPGFTSISMFSKLWEATGVSFGALVERLIDLGLARHAQRRQLCTALRR
jgi:D-alanine-D-alanine ligase